MCMRSGGGDIVWPFQVLISQSAVESICLLESWSQTIITGGGYLYVCIIPAPHDSTPIRWLAYQAEASRPSPHLYLQVYPLHTLE